MSRFTDYLWQALLLLLWAVWWGGLSFYAIVVVPNGTQQIGSVGQGFITQQVTLWHNGLTGMFVMLLAIEAFFRRSKLLWGMTAALTMIELALIAWHRHLTTAMDFAEQSVPSSFYGEHAIYLWLTAAEWLIGLSLALVWARGKDEGRRL